MTALTEFMSAREFSQAEFLRYLESRGIKLSSTHLSDVLAGKKGFSWETACRLAGVLHVSPAALMRGGEGEAA